ncbi:GatB/YqeY domain-containing protein [Arsenicicoccus sp. oral taxon 190]|uniref:GatB/YqeY domain-containing protein n=1 Tax=Arsenicicoccus sp. oral taxon 190 TaxID=1658671 RepID=UPI00067A029F|nr:GatB/YqeY domain-containing protein [Arsenicicoccus sp. oral taxon 190]AKT50472.1 glutamyl-tRNA amidotransferase [Arsenicicoccus sp. oral taxon 190]
MTTLKQTLQHDLTEAMRAHDKVRTATLRMALTAVTTAEVAGTAHELTDDEVLKVLAKEAKKRTDAVEAYQAAGREELAAAETAEREVLEGYLPAQLEDAAIEALVAEAVGETGATGMAQMGQVMKVAQAKAAGRAEGGRVAAAVRRALAS